MSEPWSPASSGTVGTVSHPVSVCTWEDLNSHLPGLPTALWGTSDHCGAPVHATLEPVFWKPPALLWLFHVSL